MFLSLCCLWSCNKNFASLEIAQKGKNVENIPAHQRHQKNRDDLSSNFFHVSSFVKGCLRLYEENNEFRSFVDLFHKMIELQNYDQQDVVITY